jgi:hypothetical protein
MKYIILLLLLIISCKEKEETTYRIVINDCWSCNFTINGDQYITDKYQAFDESFDYISDKEVVIRNPLYDSYDVVIYFNGTKVNANTFEAVAAVIYLDGYNSYSDQYKFERNGRGGLSP